MALKRLLCLVFVSVLIAGAGFRAQADDKRMMLTGSSTVAPLAAEIGKRFEKLNPGTRIDVQAGGSTRGVRDARLGLADIGMASRGLKKEEHDLRAFEIARDGIGIILNKNSAVSSLTNRQIIGIYRGEITDWGQVGGNPGPITVVNKAEGRSTLELFLHHFKLKARDIKAHVVIGDNQQGIKTVAGNRGAIGYVSIGAAEYEMNAGTSIKLLGINGIEASTANVQNGRYPLSRPLNLVTKSKPQGRIAAFIGFARSEKVHDIVRDQYFVPIRP
ncbi:MAG: phosphate ABC transporter substrate-binding protein [Rhodospirillales bacterium]